MSLVGLAQFFKGAQTLNELKTTLLKEVSASQVFYNVGEFFSIDLIALIDLD